VKDPFMHRAKHRAAGRATADVLATTLIERFAVDAAVRPTRHDAAVALIERPDAPVELPGSGDHDGDLGEAGLFGAGLFGGATPTGSFLAVPGDVPTPRRAPAPLFGEVDEPADDRPPFGASRHAARPARHPLGPRSHVKLRPQPVGTALTVTVLGAAAAVTAAVSPPVAVESTGGFAPVQKPAPDRGPDTLTGPAVVAAPAAPEQPTMHVSQLVTGVTAEMNKITPAVDMRYTTVAKTTPAASPAAMRRAAMGNALSKVGKPYRWGASGPNAFDCSGLVKWSFAQAGKALPRTSRAQSTAGTPVSRANLQPGDLVFFYKPISHVGIYIGNGKIVHASRKGQPVKVSDMGRMKFTKAVRL
jgi:cell wall-associated NlpC family hydrolase